MIWTAISLLWRGVGWALPGLSPKLILALGGATVIALLAVSGYAIGVSGKNEAILAAELARDIAWRNELEKANQNHETELTEAIAVAQRAEQDDPTPPDRLALGKLCQRDPFCADRKAGR